jgi:hypothetical protein
MNDLPAEAATRAWPADRWSALLDRAGVTYTTGDPGAKAKKSIPAGRWLNGRLRRSVPIMVGGRPAVAELRAVNSRANRKGYVLVVRYTDVESAPDAASAEPVVPSAPSSPTPTPTPTPTPAGGGMVKTGEDPSGPSPPTLNLDK